MLHTSRECVDCSDLAEEIRFDPGNEVGQRRWKMTDDKVNTSDQTSSWRRLKSIDRHCFGCGTDNLYGLQMIFETDGSRVRSQLTLGDRFRGWSSLVHGGVLATILDETMSWAAIAATEKLMLTKGMQVRYIKPVRIDTSITAIGYIQKWLSKREVEVVAEIKDAAGNLCAASSGNFPLFSRKQFLRMGIISEQEIDDILSSLD